VNFEDQVTGYAKEYRQRINATAKKAVELVVADAQRPGPAIGPPSSAGDGGRMPVVTNNLRGSISAAIGSMPRGGGVAATLIRWSPIKGETLYVGWTANYARAMEYRYGFMRGAVERWDEFVKKAAKLAQS